jgi:acyl dehydratase
MTTATVGDALPPLAVHLTREQLVRYAGASGDFNPIHYSDHWARALGLDGVIAHGMLTMGAALRVVTDWIGDPVAIRSYAARFTRPVSVPDDGDGAEVSFEASVIAVDGSLVTVGIEALCEGAKVLGAARVVVDLEAAKRM